MNRIEAGVTITGQLPQRPGYYYLATPYGKYHAGRDEAYAAALDLTGLLMLNGYVVYSPIVHCHNIAKTFPKLGRSHLYWLEYDGQMLHSACGLIVAEMDGWQESIGVNAEIMTARAMQMGIWFLTNSAWDMLTRIEKQS